MAKARDHKNVSLCRCREPRPSCTLIANVYPFMPASASALSLVVRQFLGYSSTRPKEQRK